MMHVDLESASVDHLQTLAAYFEQQAALMRDAAYRLREKEKRTAAARVYRAEAKAWHLRLGAQIYVLKSRGWSWSRISERLTMTIEACRDARSMFIREKKRRGKIKQSEAILRDHFAKMQSQDIAARHGITKRRVNQIISEAKARLTAAVSSPRPSQPIGPQRSLQARF